MSINFHSNQLLFFIIGSASFKKIKNSYLIADIEASHTKTPVTLLAVSAR